MVSRQWLLFLWLTYNYNCMGTTFYTKKNRCFFVNIYDMLGLKKMLLTYSLIYEVWVKRLWMKIVQVSRVLRRTVGIDVDWRFDNLSGSHLKSQVWSKRQDSRFCYLVLTSSYCVQKLFCSVGFNCVLLTWISLKLLVSCFFLFCEWAVCKEPVVIVICSRVFVLSWSTNFLMYAVVYSQCCK